MDLLYHCVNLSETRGLLCLAFVKIAISRPTPAFIFWENLTYIKKGFYVIWENVLFNPGINYPKNCFSLYASIISFSFCRNINARLGSDSLLESRDYFGLLYKICWHCLLISFISKDFIIFTFLGTVIWNFVNLLPTLVILFYLNCLSNINFSCILRDLVLRRICSVNIM